MQGTKIRVKGEFRDPDTNDLEDPDDVVVSVWAPDGSPTDVRRLSDSTGVVRISEGLYQTVIDTSPAAGEWDYLFEGTGVDAIVKKRTIRVRPRPAVIT